MPKTSRSNAGRFHLQKQCIADLRDPSPNLRWLSDVIENGFRLSF